MKKLFFLSVICYAANGYVLSDEEDSTKSNKSSTVAFTSSNLPIVVINTNGQGDPPDDHKITADMGIIYNGEGVRNYLTDPFNNYNGKIGIEIRGSSSQMFPKKQYGIETRDISGNDLDVSLLGFPEEADWILFAPYNDKSLIRDVLVYRLVNDMGWYASRSKFCEVVLNDEYIGVYVLLEKIKRDANRVNIKKLEPADISSDALTGGYIIKIDKTDGENNAGWLSSYLPFSQAHSQILYQYHIPKPDEIVQQQMNYIQNVIFNYETIMWYSSNIADSITGYPKYIDTDSFVDFVIINEVAKNVDAYRLSTFLYKDRDSKNPKLFAGPVWDFNLAFGNANYYKGCETDGWQLEYLTNYQNMSGEWFLTPFWWRKLFDDTKFRNKVYSRWQNVKNNSLKLQNIFHHIDSLVQLLDESKSRNFEKWPELLGHWIWPNCDYPQTYQEEITYLKDWITNRIDWLDQNMIGEPTYMNDSENLFTSNFSLEQNYPNPFNPVTNINYLVPIEALVTVKIYDLLGNEIVTLVNEIKAPGKYSIKLFSNGMTSGVYYCRMIAGDFISTRKLILLK
jgi:hypothetical protein